MLGHGSRRPRSLQTRVLVLAGAGVFCAGAVLTFVSRGSLEALDERFAAERTRVARISALAVESYLDEDLRLLTRAAGAAHGRTASAQDALNAVLHDRPEASCAFLIEAGGHVLAIAPASGCDALDTSSALARRAATTQRPLVANAVQRDGVRYIVSAVPYRGLEGAEPGAAGMAIPIPDPRLVRLLRQASAASSLEFQLRTRAGELLAFTTPRGADAGSPGPSHDAAAANVTGTEWIVSAAEAGGIATSPLLSYRRTTLWLAPVLTVVTLLLGWGIARSVRRPLTTLTRSAERLAGGDLTHPIDASAASAGGTEIARLASAFERMRLSLASSMAATAAANEALEARVEDRTRALALANTRLEEREKQRQQLIRKLIAAQEDERKRIARELHDETSQSLAALAIAVDVAAGTSGHQNESLAAMRHLVARIVDGIRRLIVDLRPSVLDDLGLAAAIRSFAEAHLTRRGVAVRCEIDDADLRLASAVETAVFRAVQEALVNVARHAQAQTVLIQIAVEGHALAIEIEDDGIGFVMEPAQADPESLRGIGLLGMRERIELVGGTVRVESEPGRGTRVVMSVPIVQEAVHV